MGESASKLPATVTYMFQPPASGASFLARRAPIARGRFCVPPVPGMMPIFVSVSAKRAFFTA